MRRAYERLLVQVAANNPSILEMPVPGMTTRNRNIRGVEPEDKLCVIERAEPEK